jgi:glycosyltransferase involved in cell wall biosynthesis
MVGDPVHHDGRAVKLSVLMPSVSSRLATKMPRVFLDLERQARGKDVEVLVLLDDRKRSIGLKRNALVSIAQGEFIAFVDDDDRVAYDYVDRLLEKIGDCDNTLQPDVIVFDVWVSGYHERFGLSDRLCSYDLDHEHQTLSDQYHRKPNHLMAWRTALVKQEPFSDSSSGEDTDWAHRICARFKNLLRQERIDKVLYSYDFDTNDTSQNG